MIRNQLLVISLMTAISASGTTSELDKYEACHRLCNEQFIADELACGHMDLAETEDASKMLQEYLQKTVSSISPHCTGNDLLLISDAICFSVENKMCNRRNKFIELAPFMPDATNVPAPLATVIAGRRLTDGCLKNYPH